jgi:hypothetical protein
MKVSFLNNPVAERRGHLQSFVKEARNIRLLTHTLGADVKLYHGTGIYKIQGLNYLDKMRCSFYAFYEAHG